MAGALIFTTIVVVITFALMAHAIGWDTYGIMSSAYWAYFTAPVALFPYPGTIAAMFFTNELVQVIIILLLSLWFFGWAGSVFLSSTRMIFAAAFDRVLPEWAAGVEHPHRRAGGGADPDGGAEHPDQRGIRLRHQLLQGDTGRHAGDRGDLRADLAIGDAAAVAAAGHLQRLADHASTGRWASR